MKRALRFDLRRGGRQDQLHLRRQGRLCLGRKGQFVLGRQGRYLALNAKVADAKVTFDLEREGHQVPRLELRREGHQALWF